VRLQAADKIIIRVIDMSDGVRIRIGGWNDIKNLISRDISNSQQNPNSGSTPYWITFKAGKISEIEEQYIP
jgi:hypothetical protein